MIFRDWTINTFEMDPIEFWIKATPIILGIIAIALVCISLVSAGSSGYNKKPNFEVGDCVNGNTITSISFSQNMRSYQVRWDKGCKICESIISGGKFDVVVFGENRTEMITEGKWIYSQLMNQEPYNEFKWNVYYEKKSGDCNKILGKNDFRFSFGSIGTYYGWTSWKDSTSYGEITFNKNYKSKVSQWTFLIYHEMGHYYLQRGHTNDGSIMDANGGDHVYHGYQIKAIRERLSK